jgi:hypothetical protein
MSESGSLAPLGQCAGGMSAYPLITDMMGAIENGRDVPNHPLVRPSETDLPSISALFQGFFTRFSGRQCDFLRLFCCPAPSSPGRRGASNVGPWGQPERRGGCRALRHIVSDFTFRRDRRFGRGEHASAMRLEQGFGRAAGGSHEQKCWQPHPDCDCRPG